MVRKTKLGKTRRDKYYKMAKEQGYRSRASFKLIQLNREYDFLSTSTSLLDLCAAPGGWLQVAAKFMPVSSVIVGVDLFPIKPIPGVYTFTADITTPYCRSELRKIFKKQKIDTVIHDGAPNMGTAWIQDAYTQNVLTLAALKLATEFLAPGGTFVTKVFRSRDYNALHYIFNSLFKKVVTTKPKASRNTSAEIYVICSGFLAPERIDPRFFQPAWAFKELGKSKNPSNPDAARINLFKREKKKKQRNREGYDDRPMFVERTVHEFITAEDEISLLAEASVLRFDDKDSFRYLGHPATTKYIQELCKDVKRLGKSDLKALLKWRRAIRETLDLDKKEEKKEEEEEKEEKDEIKDDLEVLEKAEKKRLRRERNIKNKMMWKYTQRMNLGMNTPYDILETNATVRLFDLKKLEGDKEAIEEFVKSGKDLDEIEDKKKKEQKSKSVPKKKIEIDDETYVDLIEQQMDAAYERYLDRKEKLRKRYLRESREEREIMGLEDASGGELRDAFDEEEYLRNRFVPELSEKFDKIEGIQGESSGSESDSVYDSGDEVPEGYYDGYEPEIPEAVVVGDDAAEAVAESDDEGNLSDTGSDDEDDLSDTESDDEDNLSDTESDDEERADLKRQANIWFGKPEFDILESVSDSEDESGGPKERSNKKLISVTKEEFSRIPFNKRHLYVVKDEDESDSDDDPDLDDDIKDVDGYATSILTDHKGIDDLKTPGDGKKKFLDVKNEDVQKAIAISRKFIDRKKKQEIIDNSYNRYAFNDRDSLPQWFVDDERENVGPVLPITQDELMEIKDQVMDINARPMKKVIEAKIRKKIRNMKKMAKLKQMSNSILNSTELSEYDKARELEKMYKKMFKKKKRRTVYVVSTKGGIKESTTTDGVGKARIKYVDSRMKKDKKPPSKYAGKRKKRYKRRRK